MPLAARAPAAAVTCFVLALHAAACLAVQEATASDKTFQLGKYVKGTAAEIRQTIQGPVDEFTEKTKEAKRRVAACEAAIEAARASALPRARATEKYRRLAASAAEAERDLERARRSGSVQQRLDASSRLNRARAGMEGVVNESVKADGELTLQKARLDEDRESVRRCEESLKKATAWRDQWVYAIECTFRMNAPIAVGSEGVLTTVRVIKPPGPGHEGLLVLYEAAERTGLGAEVEGIQTVNVVMKKERLLLGPDTPGADTAKAGDVLKLFRHYRVESTTVNRDGPVYVTARHAADIDALMAEIMPLRKD